MSNNETVKKFDIHIKLRGDNVYDLYLNDDWKASRGSYLNILDEAKALIEADLLAADDAEVPTCQTN